MFTNWIISEFHRAKHAAFHIDTSKIMTTDESDSLEPEKRLHNKHLCERPLRMHEADLLGRSRFVKQYARILAETPNEESVVFALYGSWGEGKTSALSLIQTEFESDTFDRTPPVVIQFSPWIFNSRKELFNAFFEDIANSIGENKKIISNAEEKSKRWKRLGTTASLIGGSIDNIDTVLSLFGLSIPGGKVATTIGKKIKDITNEAAELEINAPKQSLKTVKNALCQSMEAERPILIVMDDIDRLIPKDLIELLHLLKAIADIPNVHYLLLCDKNRIEDSLEKHIGDPSYLEKIIQFQAHLPTVDRKHLELFLKDSLSNLFEECAPGDNRLKDSFFEDFSNSLLVKTFTDLRSVKRYIGSLRFTFPSLVRHGFFLLNPHDFLHLEAIKHLDHNFIEFIIEHQDVFTGGSDARITGVNESKYSELTESFKSSLDSKFEEGKSPIIKELIQSLLPSSHNPDSETQRSKKRIKSDRWFSSYFTLESLNFETTLTNGDIQEINRNRENIHQLTEFFTAKLRDVELSDILSTLKLNWSGGSHYQHKEIHRPLLTALLTALKHRGESGLEVEFLEGEIIDYMESILNNHETDERIKFLTDVLESSGNFITGSCLLVRWESTLKKRPDLKKHLERLISAIGLVTTKLIESECDSGLLKLTNSWNYIQEIWSKHGNKDKLAAWLDTQTNQDIGLKNYLEAIGRYSDDPEETKYPFLLHYNQLDDFSAPGVIAERCKKLESAANDDREKGLFKIAAERFDTAQTYVDGKHFFTEECPSFVKLKIHADDMPNIDHGGSILITAHANMEEELSAEANNANMEKLRTYLKGKHSFISDTFNISFDVNDNKSNTRTPYYFIQHIEYERALTIGIKFNQKVLYKIGHDQIVEIWSCDGKYRHKIGNVKDMLVRSKKKRNIRINNS